MRAAGAARRCSAPASAAVAAGPLGVVTGLVLAFTFATVALVYVIDALGLPDDLVRTLAIVTLFGFGITLLIPGLGDRIEAFGSRIAPGPGAGRRLRDSAPACCSAPASASSTRPAPGRSSRA